jgi:hypothetical protein
MEENVIGKETEARTVKEVRLSSIVFDEKIYPRKSVEPALVQQYAENLNEIEALGNYMVIDQKGNLLDGRHRHLAYLKRHADDDAQVLVYCLEVEGDAQRFSAAVELNSTHGKQLTAEDKKRCALALYSEHRFTIEEIARLLSVRKQSVSDWTTKIRKEERQRLIETVFDLWLSCHTCSEIAATTGKPEGTIKGIIADEQFRSFPGPKRTKLSLFEDFNDGDGHRPWHNAWRFTRNQNDSTYFGNSDPRILKYLFYLYTDPFDIVVDPFAGGGTIIDVCRERLRRYWASDRKPVPEREGHIRPLDIAREMPALNNRWSDVRLTFLDPPYWKQAERRYSNDPEDLGNMSLDDFNDCLAGIINAIARRQTKGFIALLIQPTQWNAPERRFTDHAFEMMRRVDERRLQLEMRISCPLGTQQCLPPMVKWAKTNRKLLVLNRELVVWEIVEQ